MPISGGPYNGIGPATYVINVDWGRKNPKPGHYLSLADTENDFGFGKVVHRHVKITRAFIFTAFSTAPSSIPDTTEDLRVRLWGNDAREHANILGELRGLHYSEGDIATAYHAQASMHTGELTTASQVGFDADTEEEVTEILVHKGVTIVAEWERHGGGLSSTGLTGVALELKEQ